MGACGITSALSFVPNAPCGVESSCGGGGFLHDKRVPNAPCGVERSMSPSALACELVFLMHRVELKVFIASTATPTICKFLMHRVELKEVCFLPQLPNLLGFLMHRVELKVLWAVDHILVKVESS